MSAQEKTEEVLRKIHVFFSKAEPYNGSKRSVIVDKNSMMDLLKELNDCIYDMMDEYELTNQARDKAERRLKKEADDQIFEARKKAEDIYAASLMFADHSLNDIVDIIDEAHQKMQSIENDLLNSIDAEKDLIKGNQLDLKGNLQDLIDSQKYMRLIDDENEWLRKEKESGIKTRSSEDDKPSYADVTPEIVVNNDYFIKTGQMDAPLDENLDLKEGEPLDKEAPVSEDKSPNDENNVIDFNNDEIPQSLSDDLDNEYFDWKDENEKDNEKPKKKGFSFFGKKD